MIRHFKAYYPGKILDYQYERENLGIDSGDDSEYHILPLRLVFLAYSLSV